VIGKVDGAEIYLSTASSLLQRGKSRNASALVDGASRLLYLANRRSSQIRTSNRAFAGIRSDVQASLGNSYLATRKFRLSIIDLAGGNRTQATKDLVVAHAALKLSQRESNRALRALHKKTS